MILEISIQAILNAITDFIPKQYLMLSENNIQTVHNNIIKELNPKTTQWDQRFQSKQS